MPKFNERDPFDPREKFEPERVLYGIATTSAGIAIFAGVSLITAADFHDVIGFFRAGAGALLCLAAGVGFWMYWNRP